MLGVRGISLHRVFFSGYQCIRRWESIRTFVYRRRIRTAVSIRQKIDRLRIFTPLRAPDMQKIGYLYAGCLSNNSSSLRTHALKLQESIAGFFFFSLPKSSLQRKNALTCEYKRVKRWHCRMGIHRLREMRPRVVVWLSGVSGLTFFDTPENAQEKELEVATRICAPKCPEVRL